MKNPSDAKTLSRRMFVKAGVATAALATLPIWTQPRRARAQDAADAAKPEPKPEVAPDAKADEAVPGKGKAKRLIILSLRGGPSHIDTFDPKTDEGVRGEFKAINTAVDGMKFTEVFPALAKVAGELCVVRSITSREGNHERARYLTHTGHIPNPTLKHPTLGSILAKEFGKDDFDLPHFVAVGGGAEDGGYLGPVYSPMIIQDPEKGVENVKHRVGMDDERMGKRLALRDAVDGEFRDKRNKEIADAQKAMYDKAQRMMKSEKIAAFDLTRESKETRDAYGRNGFGQGVLLARRLVETGVTAVEVTLNGFDTHQDNFGRHKTLCEMLDTAFAKLIGELKERKLLDETVISCYGEFGRTPDINGDKGRDHYPRAWSAVLAGGPFVRGKSIGATDERGAAVVAPAIEIPDMFRSFAHAYGFDPLKQYEVNDRPMWYVDKKGKLVRELFA